MNTNNYNLNIYIRKGMEDRFIQSIQLDLSSFVEILKIKELSIFDKDAYITVSLDPIIVD